MCFGCRHAEAWLGYVATAISVKDFGCARAVFKRCHTFHLADSGQEAICQSWLRFEREYGSADDYFQVSRFALPFYGFVPFSFFWVENFMCEFQSAFFFFFLYSGKI